MQPHGQGVACRTDERSSIEWLSQESKKALAIKPFVSAHDDHGGGRRFGSALQNAEHLRATDARQRPIANDDIRSQLNSEVQTFFWRAGRYRVKAGSLQNETRHMRDLGVVIDDEDTRFIGSRNT